MKILLMFISLLSYSVHCCCQNDLIVYNKFELPRIGTVLIPSNFEVQAGKYKVVADSIKNEILKKWNFRTY